MINHGCSGIVVANTERKISIVVSTTSLWWITPDALLVTISKGGPSRILWAGQRHGPEQPPSKFRPEQVHRPYSVRYL